MFEEFLQRKYRMNLDDFFCLCEPERNKLREEFWSTHEKEKEEMENKYDKPTEEQFRGYLKIQKSGETNMFDVRKVLELADGSGLTRSNCIYIFTGDNYRKLCEEYEVGVDTI